MPLAYSLIPLLLCMAIVTWQAFSADPHMSGRDFMHSGWISARLALEGENPYAPNQDEVRRLAGDYLTTLQAEGGRSYNTGATYVAVYPYWAILLQTPLGLLDFPTALLVWTLFSGMLLLAGLYLALSAARQRLDLTISPLMWAVMLLGFGLAALVFAPTVLHFSLGQYSLIIFFLLALLFLPNLGAPISGLAFALATLKPQLSALVLALLLFGWMPWARRKVAWALGFITLLYLGPALFLPYTLTDWFKVNFLTNRQATNYAPVSSSWWGLADHWAAPLPGQWWVAVAVALCGLTLLLLIAPLRSALAARDLQPLLPLVVIITLLLTPYTIAYDQVLLLLPLAWLWLRLANGSRLTLLLRLSLLVWATALPLLLATLSALVVQGAGSNYIKVFQTIAMLGLYYLTDYATLQTAKPKPLALRG